MFYTFERASCPPSASHTKERRKEKAHQPPLMHDYKKVSGLRSLVKALIEDAQAATCKKQNREKAIQDALSPLTSEKVTSNNLMRFAKGERLLPKQEKALRATITNWLKKDTLPSVWQRHLTGQQDSSSAPCAANDMTASIARNGCLNFGR